MNSCPERGLIQKFPGTGSSWAQDTDVKCDLHQESRSKFILNIHIASVSMVFIPSYAFVKYLSPSMMHVLKSSSLHAT